MAEEAKTMRKVDANCRILFRATPHLRRVFLVTRKTEVAGVKFLSRDYNHKVKDWLIAISHGGLGNDSSVTQYPDLLRCPGCKASNSL